MDTTDKEIQFDENGICNHCINYYLRLEKEVFVGEERVIRLNRIVSKIKDEGKNKDYDCIAGLSGGVDSTYTVLNLKKLGLRPLVVHLDNGWNSELAVDNINRTLKTLGFDLFTHVIDWEEFRDIQLSYLYASVINCEVPTDHAINA
ncbi:MAG TPA: N-acetyl sugar amidotransferase, partial [Bacteroidia bacterium]|nr:N-acetyl sugar amidotransferase [Bacteroidia bacterium]